MVLRSADLQSDSDNFFCISYCLLIGYTDLALEISAHPFRQKEFVKQQNILYKLECHNE